MMKKYRKYMLEQLEAIINIDSPTGFTEKVTDYLMEEYTRLGYQPVKTEKGGVLVDLGGTGNGLLTMAHGDTLGAIVAEVKSSGALRVSPLGGFHADNAEAENCRIYTYDGKTYEGTFVLHNPSAHVNKNLADAKRDFDSVEVILDEDVHSKEDVLKLGIHNGCFVCADPRFHVTESGYIKSRFLDDKLSTAILLGIAKYLKDEKISLGRKVYQHITVYEEVGHGACGTLPSDVTEVLSVDMGCVGDGLECSERQVSICVKDSNGPYNYEIVKELTALAEKNKLDYALDVYPYYGSDADAALSAGLDAKHALIGAGVFASHGYERSHVDGMMNTFRLIAAYLEEK